MESWASQRNACSVDAQDVVNNVQQKMTSQRQKQKHYADQHTRNASEIRTGDKVRMWENNRHWTPGVVINRAITPRSYWVQMGSGQYRRYTSNTSSLETTTNMCSKPSTRPEVSNETVPPQQTTPTQNQPAQTTSRSGRTVKPVVRLDL